MSGLSTHVLDTAAGRPAAAVAVTVERRRADGSWEPLGSTRTGGDGRVADLLADAAPLQAGVYRLVFAVGDYFDVPAFYPEVSVAFEVRDPAEHHHVPLLLAPHGYSTYRGQ